MIRTILGALLGRVIDRRDGDNGVGGAVIGALATRAVTRMGPLGMLIGGGYMAKKAYDRRKAGRTGTTRGG